MHLTCDPSTPHFGFHTMCPRCFWRRHPKKKCGLWSSLETLVDVEKTKKLPVAVVYDPVAVLWEPVFPEAPPQDTMSAVLLASEAGACDYPHCLCLGDLSLSPWPPASHSVHWPFFSVPTGMRNQSKKELPGNIHPGCHPSPGEALRGPSPGMERLSPECSFWERPIDLSEHPAMGRALWQSSWLTHYYFHLAWPFIVLENNSKYLNPVQYFSGNKHKWGSFRKPHLNFCPWSSFFESLNPIQGFLLSYIFLLWKMVR